MMPTRNQYTDIDEKNDIRVDEPSQFQCQQHEHDRTKQGIFLLFISAFLFSLMGLCLQFTGRMGIPSTEMVFIRATFQGTFVVWGMIICRVDDDSMKIQMSKSAEDNLRNNSDFVYEEKKDEEEDIMYQTDNDNDDGNTKLTSNNNQSSYTTFPTYTISSHHSLLPPRIIQRPFGNTTSIRNIVLLRGVIGGFGFLNYYYTLSTLPLGDATTLLSLYPIVTIFLAWFVLGEPIKIPQVTAAMFSAVGACLICRPSFLFHDDHDVNDATTTTSRPPTLGYITALLGSLCASCVIVLIRKAGNVGAHTLQLLFSWAVFGILFSLIVGIVLGSYSEQQRWIVPPREETLPILGVCVAGSIAHFLLNYAARLAPATVGALVRSSDIGWAYMLQVIVLDEKPRNETWLGVLFICSSLVLVVLARSDNPQRNEGGSNNNDETRRSVIGDIEEVRINGD